MNPIYEQRKGHGIGYSEKNFIERFQEICKDHLTKGKAKAFSFIFYNFKDKNIRKILKDGSVFTKLDRLSGNDLTIFYFHFDSKKRINDFNYIFLGAFEVDFDLHNLPLFFQMKSDQINNLEIVEINQDNLNMAFQELYEIIENYIQRLKNKNVDTGNIKINKLIKMANNLMLNILMKSMIEKLVMFLKVA